MPFDNRYPLGYIPNGLRGVPQPQVYEQAPAGTSTGMTENFTDANADRPPTEQEAEAAERAATDVDIDEVAEHFEEMTEIGKNVKGEGSLNPSGD